MAWHLHCSPNGKQYRKRVHLDLNECQVEQYERAIVFGERSCVSRFGADGPSYPACYHKGNLNLTKHPAERPNWA